MKKQKKQQDELIQTLNDKIKNLEATVNKLQQELEKATNLVSLEKKRTEKSIQSN